MQKSTTRKEPQSNTYTICGTVKVWLRRVRFLMCGSRIRHRYHLPRDHLSLKVLSLRGALPIIHTSSSTGFAINGEATVTNNKGLTFMRQIDRLAHRSNLGLQFTQNKTCLGSLAMVSRLAMWCKLPWL